MNLNEILMSKDNITSKFKFKTGDNYIIDVVLVERKEKNIICFPSQIGCILLCKFCNSGDFKRNLYPDEIYDCIEKVKDHIKNKNKPLLISCMGEGEPSLNPNIVDIIDKIYKSGSKLSIATTGINPPIFKKLNQFSDKLKVMLSLHATTTYDRKNLLHNCMDIDYLFNKFLEYKGKKEVNYVLLERFNDSMKDCLRLKKICKKIPVKLNKYNKAKSFYSLNGSNNIKRFMFMYKLLLGKIEYYETDGTDIQAACGMMTYQID